MNNFKNTVEMIPGLKWYPGLQALSDVNKRHISVEVTNRLRGSVELDESFQEVDPDGNRWDYGVAYYTDNVDCIYWIEVHSASSTSNVAEIVRKATWLKEWLRSHKPLFNDFSMKLVWISSGRTVFTATSPQAKKAASAGITITGRHFRIP